VAWWYGGRAGGCCILFRFEWVSVVFSILFWWVGGGAEGLMIYCGGVVGWLLWWVGGVSVIFTRLSVVFFVFVLMVLWWVVC